LGSDFFDSVLLLLEDSLLEVAGTAGATAAFDPLAPMINYLFFLFVGGWFNSFGSSV